MLLAVLLVGCAEDKNHAFQGYTEGEYVRIAAPIAGSLTLLNVVRGSQVSAGDALFALEQENEVAARGESAERLKAAEAQLEDLKKGKRAPELDTVKAQLAQAQADFKLAATQVQRQEKLVAANFATKENLDTARFTFERARARVAELTSQLEAAHLSAREDTIIAASAEAEAARAALAQADWRLAQKSVKAPVQGLVADTIYVQGEWVPAGSPVVSLLPPQNIKIRFFVPEEILGALQTGQTVNVVCDGCKKTIAAKISYISPQAEYTPPVIYSKESRSKLVFLIEARPALADALTLHPGQPVDVSVGPP